MAEDELTRLRAENVRLKNELDKQVNAWGGYVDAHAGNYSRMNARIAELEATVAERDARIAELKSGFDAARRVVEMQLQTIARLEQEVKGYRLSAAVMEGAYVTSDDAVTKLKETIARLEADNRRLRHLDAMPVDAIVRLMDNCGYATDCDYSERAYHADWTAANDWFKSRDGDA